MAEMTRERAREVLTQLRERHGAGWPEADAAYDLALAALAAPPADAEVERAREAVDAEFPTMWDMDAGKAVQLAPARTGPKLDALIAAARTQGRREAAEAVAGCEVTTAQYDTAYPTSLDFIQRDAAIRAARGE